MIYSMIRYGYIQTVELNDEHRRIQVRLYPGERRGIPRVIPDWRREQGHRLSLTDLREVIEYGPEALVIGTGAGGVMKVPRDILDELEDMGIETITAGTAEAVLEYNGMIVEGRRVAAALHLTC